MYPGTDELIILAVMGSNQATGDAIDIDHINTPATLKFGIGEAANVAVPISDDFDLDGNLDLAFSFQTQNSGIFCNDTEVSLKGETYAGEPFSGTDTIDEPECTNSACHD